MFTFFSIVFENNFWVEFNESHLVQIWHMHMFDIFGAKSYQNQYLFDSVLNVYISHIFMVQQKAWNVAKVGNFRAGNTQDPDGKIDWLLDCARYANQIPGFRIFQDPWEDGEKNDWYPIFSVTNI